MRTKLKLEIQTSFWLKGEIEKKNQFNKRTKKPKEWGPNWKKIIYEKLGLKKEIENK
jgi:hypothetical protein